MKRLTAAVLALLLMLSSVAAARQMPLPKQMDKLSPYRGMS